MSETAGEAIADTLHRWALEDECGEELDGWIYVIACAEPKSFKIGFTKKHPSGRLKQLQTGNPSPLVLLGWYPGSQREERRLHEAMAEFRLVGEWFRADEGANDILRGPFKCLHINNLLTGHNAEMYAE